MLSELFPAANPNHVFEDEENQTYGEFVEMGKRKPNRKGTGRNKLTIKRNKLLIIYFGSEQDKPTYIKSSFLLNYLTAYFLVDVDIIDQYDAIDYENNILNLDNDQYDIIINNTKAKSKSKRSTSSNVQKFQNRNKKNCKIDVFELFDVLVNKVNSSPNYYSVIGLFDVILTEDNSPIMGRACGDRVCCISLVYCPTIRSLFATMSHEILHTFGLDHNTQERCIMNAISGEEEEDEWMELFTK
eukprot:gene14444-19383_t